MRTRLTERDLSRIVRRVINEQDEDIIDLSPVDITAPMKTKEFPDVTVTYNKTKNLCIDAVDLMKDITLDLNSYKNSPDAKTKIEEDSDLNNNIKDLMKKLQSLISVPFSKDDNYIGL
jgi:hypothetical protein